MGYFGGDVIGGFGVEKEQIGFGQVTKYTEGGPAPNSDGSVGLANLPSAFQNKNFVQVLY